MGAVQTGLWAALSSILTTTTASDLRHLGFCPLPCTQKAES